MIDPIIVNIIQQIPALAALIWLMTLVFKYISARDKFIQELHKEHQEARAASREVIEANTRVVGESTEVMRNVIEVVRGCRMTQDAQKTAK
jgi:uncharacterized membrane protein